MKREFITVKKKKLTISIDDNAPANVKALWDGKLAYAKLFDKEEIQNLAPDPEKFKNNIKSKVDSSPLFPWLVWPLDYFEGADGTFVYVSDLISDEYIPLTEYMDGSPKLKKWSVMYTAALELVWIFHTLHVNKYYFLNMTNEDVWIDVNTGQVMITGAEWLGDQKTGGYLKSSGDPVLIHPLCYFGKKAPDQITDQYLLSVLLFEVLCQHHPLIGHEAARWPVLKDAHRKKIYGTDPVFIFDPENESNRPVKGVHLRVSGFWNRCPDCIKKKFYCVFLHSAMNDSNKVEVSEAMWYEVLNDVRSSLFTDSAGTENILTESAGRKLKGQESHKEIEKIAPLSWKIEEGGRERSFLLIPGNKIYAGQLDFHELSDPIKTVGEIARGENANLCYILNKTQEQWEAYYKDIQFLTKPGGMLLVKAGMTVQMGKTKIWITETKVTG